VTPCDYQVPSDGEEADGKDEALAPTDMNCITGDTTLYWWLCDGFAPRYSQVHVPPQLLLSCCLATV